MFWEEKIDIIKKKYDSKDFKVPFTNWSEIFGQIERRFIVKKNSQNHYKNWIGNIKDKIQIQIVTDAILIEQLNVLGRSENFWLVIISGNEENGRHLIYDCKLPVIVELINMSDTSFLIVHKKYDWLACFEKMGKQKTIIAKSGNNKTPFG